MRFGSTSIVLLLGVFLHSQAFAARPPVDCSQVIETLWADHRCFGGCSNDNVARFVEAAKGIDFSKAKVLVLRRPQTFYAFIREPNLVLLNERERGTYPASFHVVLTYKGWIYDPSASDGSTMLPRSQYFKNMFLSNGRRLSIRETGVSNAHRRRLSLQAERRAIASMADLLDQVLVTEIPAPKWVSENAQVRRALDHDVTWRSLSERHRTRSLGDYLANQRHPTLPPETSESLPWNPYTFYVGAAKISVFEAGLEVGDLAEVPSAVRVHRDGERHARAFSRTTRGLSTLRALVPARMLDVSELRGKLALDATMGGGIFVEEVREAGGLIFGLDLGLTQYQKRQMLIDTRNKTVNGVALPKTLESKPFIWGDSFQTRLAGDQIDVIYDLYGLSQVYFANFGRPGFEGVRKAYEEWRRILKVGGIIRFGPFDEADEANVRRFFSTMPGFQIEKIEANPESRNIFDRFGEVRRVK